jgi:hypothetical protein
MHFGVVLSLTLPLSPRPVDVARAGEVPVLPARTSGWLVTDCGPVIHDALLWTPCGSDRGHGVLKHVRCERVPLLLGHVLDGLQVRVRGLRLRVHVCRSIAADDGDAQRVVVAAAMFPHLASYLLGDAPRHQVELVEIHAATVTARSACRDTLSVCSLFRIGYGLHPTYAVAR